MKLSVKGVSISAGITGGIALLVVTIIRYAAGGGKLLYLLDRLMPGYSVSPSGAVVGFVWAFMYAFVGGLIFALIYNLFAKERP